jgi:radical SAM protein with 4Fe4S-binding SPASM domain
MIVRHERWGAWVKLESMPAIVALDHAGVAALGVARPASVPERRRPLEVHVAVTSRCGAGCAGCYTGATPAGDEVPIDDLLATLRAVAAGGVFSVALGGGEPTLHPEIDRVAAEAVRLGMTAVLTTSGHGLTDERIERLRAFAQINVSYDGEGAQYAAVRGYDGATAAESAIARLVARGMRVGVNVVLTRRTFGTLHATVARARALGAREVQLLRFKPGGRTTALDYAAQKLAPEQVAALPATLAALVRDHGPAHADGLRLRIDCSMVPLLSADPALDASALEALGVLGCVAGDELAAVTVAGRVAPCSFLPATSQLGTTLAHGLDDEAFAAARATPAEPCGTCALRAVCRGGCKAVTLATTGAPGPDPDCPRVLALRARSRPSPAPAAE